MWRDSQVAPNKPCEPKDLRSDRLLLPFLEYLDLEDSLATSAVDRIALATRG